MPRDTNSVGAPVSCYHFVCRGERDALNGYLLCFFKDIIQRSLLLSFLLLFLDIIKIPMSTVSFLARIARLWNTLPEECLSLNYN